MARVEGAVTHDDGEVVILDVGTVLAPLEGALVAMSWGVVLLATALVVARLG